MVWIDVKKAYDSLDHGWLVKQELEHKGGGDYKARTHLSQSDFSKAYPRVMLSVPGFSQFV